MDPDELFMSEVKKVITITDKRLFWEMARTIMDLPLLASRLKRCLVKNSRELAALLKNPEYRILWSPEGPEYLPKDAATELISAAYCAIPNFANDDM